MAPFSMPVTAEDTWRSAWGNMLIGRASQRSPSQAMPARSSFRTGRRAAGTNASATNPTAKRTKVTPSGGSASSPTAISRNEQPQMRPGSATSAQSPSTLGARFVRARA